MVLGQDTCTSSQNANDSHDDVDDVRGQGLEVFLTGNDKERVDRKEVVDVRD